MKTAFQLFALILIGSVWLSIFVHPIIIAFYYGNPLWLGLYLLIWPEIFIASIITTVLLAASD